MNKIVRSGTCKSLSGGSTLTYNIGFNEEKGLMICVAENSGHGLFNKDWVSLREVETLLAETQEPFASKALSPVFKGKSANSSGFLMAALLKEGLVVEPTSKGNRFVLADLAGGMAGGSDEVPPDGVTVDTWKAGEE